VYGCYTNLDGFPFNDCGWLWACIITVFFSSHCIFPSLAILAGDWPGTNDRPTECVAGRVGGYRAFY
jgi:hypothetical protein